MKAFKGLLLLIALVAPNFSMVAAAATTPPPTCRLYTSSTTVAPNTRVRLDWESTNASSGYLTDVGAISAKSFTYVVPGKNTTYAASFTGPGGSVVCRVAVAVRAAASVSPTGPINTGTPIDTSKPANLNSGNVTLPTAQATAPAAANDNASIFSDGIVPAECRGSSTTATCDLCSLGQMTQNLLNFLLGLSIPLCALLFAWAGILYFSARGVPAQLDRAHKIFKSVAIGFVLVICAWAIINTAITMLVQGSDYKSWSWTSLDCSQTRQARLLNKSLSDYITTSLPGLSGYTGPTSSGVQINSNGTMSGGSITCDSSGNCFSGGLLVNPPGGNIVSCDVSLGACFDKDQKVVTPAPPVDTSLTDKNRCGGGSWQYDAMTEQCVNDSTQEVHQACASGQTYIPDYQECVAMEVPKNSADCSPDTIQNAAASGGYSLTDAQAATLSCIAVPESACGRNTNTATTPGGQVTSATGMFQIVMGYKDDCHSLNIPVCTEAAQSAGYDVSGSLNCSQHFKAGRPIDEIGQACKAAASNINCNASAAACLVKSANGKFTDWTADPRSAAQQSCIQKYSNI